MSVAASSAAKIASMPPIGAIKNQTKPPNSPNVAQKHAVHQKCMMGNTIVPPRIFQVPLTLILLTFLACQSDMTARSTPAGATERYQGTKMIENDNTETSRIRLRERKSEGERERARERERERKRGGERKRERGGEKEIARAGTGRESGMCLQGVEDSRNVRVPVNVCTYVYVCIYIYIYIYLYRCIDVICNNTCVRMHVY